MEPTPTRPNAAVRPPESPAGASVGIFLALLAALLMFSRASTALLRYPDRAFGIGLSNGVDPARRYPIYLGLVALVLGVWLAYRYGSRLLGRVRPSWRSGVRARLENDLCALFAAAGSVAIVARVSADRLDRLGSALMCLAGLALVAVFALVRRLSPRPRWWPRQLGSLNLVAIVVLLAWPASQIAGVLVDAQGTEKAGLVRAGTVLLPLTYALAVGYFVHRAGRNRRAAVCRAFMLGAAPFFAFPSLCPVANEVQHALAQGGGVAPRSVALGFLLLLALLGALLFWLGRAGERRCAPRRVLARYVYPTIIFGEALLSVHKHVLANKRIDPLHDGEQITAVHQLLAFDKWPFVDIWPAHGLFDYVGAVYSLANGFRPLETTAWNGLIAALSATAAYAILANVCTPLFAFVVAALLPIEAILPLPAYSYFCAEPGLIAVGLLACLALERPSLARSALLSLATFLCFFWTPTSGVASIAAVLGLILLALITTRERRPVWCGLAVFGATGAGVFVAYVLVLLSRGQPVLETWRLIRAFMQADPLIGGRPSVLERFDAPAFVQYVILPGIGLVYLAKLARHALERKPLGHTDRLLGFLTLVSFVLFARTLTRHGIIEHYQPFYFPLLALCAWIPGQPGAALIGGISGALHELPGALAGHFRQRASARAAFCVGLALYLVWMPMRSHKRLVFDPYEFHAWQPGESRYQGEVPAYPTLSAFLAGTLGPKDSFVELLNMPVLYGLLDREVPGQFFLPTMFYATDGVQDSYLGRLTAFGSARVPVVLLPDEQGRNIDETLNTLHGYRIAEHVFRNYVPFGKMDGLDVWVSRTLWEEAAHTVKPRPLAFRDPSTYRAHSVALPRLDAGVLQIAVTDTDPHVEDAAEVDGIPIGGLAAHHAVRLSYRASVSGELRLFYDFGSELDNDTASGRAALATSQTGEWRSVEVPIPAQGDPTRVLRRLRIDPPAGMRLEVRDLMLVFGEPAAREPECHVGDMLPFFWGNFDAQHAARSARVLETLAVPEDRQPRAAFTLMLNPGVDKRSGNYLKLCIRLPGFDSAPPSGAWTTVNHEGNWHGAAKVTLSYGASPAATFAFDVVQPTAGTPGLPKALVRSFAEECKPYLVRLSAQYAWNSQAVTRIDVASNSPIVLDSASVLAGD